MQLRVDALTAFLSDHCKDGLGEGHPLASCPGSGRQLTPKHVRCLTSIVRHQLLRPDENLLSASAFEHLVQTQRNQTSHGQEAAAVNILREIFGLARMRAGPGWRGSRPVRQQVGEGQSALAPAKQQQQQQQQQQLFAEPRCESSDVLSPRPGSAQEPDGTFDHCRPPTTLAAAAAGDDGPRRKRSKSEDKSEEEGEEEEEEEQPLPGPGGIDQAAPTPHHPPPVRKRQRADCNTTGAEVKSDDEGEEEDDWGDYTNKRTREQVGFHIASENETLQQISTKLRVDVRSLRELNLAWRGEDINPSAKLKAKTPIVFEAAGWTEGSVVENYSDDRGGALWRVRYSAAVSNANTDSDDGFIIFEKTGDEVRAACWAYEAHHEGWKVSGPHVGERVCYADGTAVGTVVGFMPDAENQHQQWKVHWDDFDEETLGCEDLKTAKELYTTLALKPLPLAASALALPRKEEGVVVEEQEEGEEEEERSVAKASAGHIYDQVPSAKPVPQLLVEELPAFVAKIKSECPIGAQRLHPCIRDDCSVRLATWHVQALLQFCKRGQFDGSDNALHESVVCNVRKDVQAALNKLRLVFGLSRAMRKPNGRSRKRNRGESKSANMSQDKAAFKEQGHEEQTTQEEEEKPRYNYYLAKNDESPAEIAIKLGSNLHALLSLNRSRADHRLSGLSSVSRLKPGTDLWLPFPDDGAATSYEPEFQVKRVLRSCESGSFQVLWLDGSLSWERKTGNLEETLAMQQYEERQKRAQMDILVQKPAMEGLSRLQKQACTARQALRQMIMESLPCWTVVEVGAEQQHLVFRPTWKLPSKDRFVKLIVNGGFVSAENVSAVFPFLLDESGDIAVREIPQLVFGLSATQVLSVAYVKFIPKHSLISMHAFRAVESSELQCEHGQKTLKWLARGLDMDLVVETNLRNLAECTPQSHASTESMAETTICLRVCSDKETQYLSRVVGKYFKDTIWAATSPACTTLRALHKTSSGLNKAAMAVDKCSPPSTIQLANEPMRREKRKRPLTKGADWSRFIGVIRELDMFRVSRGEVQGGLFGTEQEAARESDKLARSMESSEILPMNFPENGEVGFAVECQAPTFCVGAKQNAVCPSPLSHTRKPLDVCLKATVHVNMSDQLRAQGQWSKQRYGCVQWMTQHDYKVEDSSMKPLVERATATFRHISSHLSKAGAGGSKPLDDFRPMQLETIVACTQNERGAQSNVVLHLETGGGKSLIYLVLAQMQERIVIVVQPLRRLKAEQRDTAQAAGCHAVLLEGGKRDETAQIMHDIVRGEKLCDILFLTPEMWGMNSDVSEALLELQKYDRIERVVIDEAHCVASCDESGFRPEYRFLGERILKLQVPVLCLTASMTQQVVGTLIGDFHLNPRTDIFLRGSYTEHLKCHTLRVIPKSSKDDTSGVVASVKRDCANGSGIVFCLEVKDSEKVCAALREAGVEADFYNSKRSSADLEKVYTRWQNGTLPALVATAAFGMGIDPVCRVAYIHHFQPPHNLSELQQHLGRARCRGHPVMCDIFYHEKDRKKAARALRLPIVPSDPAQNRQDFDLSELYRVLLAPTVCLRQAVVSAAMPIPVKMDQCGVCSACDARAQCTDVSEELSKLWGQLLQRNTTVSMAELQQHMETRGDANAHYAGLARKLIFAGTMSSVLLEEKLQPDAPVCLAKGKNWLELGKGVQISFSVDPNDDMGTVDECRQRMGACSSVHDMDTEAMSVSSDDGADDDLVLYEVYTVSNNDTPEKVAKRLGVDVNELVELNLLNDRFPELHRNSKLKAGTNILVPDGIERSRPVISKLRYGVRSILERKGQPGSYLYKVLWEAGNSSTWEPATNLKTCQQLVAEFDRQVLADSAAAPSDGHASNVEDLAFPYVSVVDEPRGTLLEAVNSFGLLTRWCAECLICDQHLTWQMLEADSQAVADLSRTDDPVHLQRVVDRQWRWLPPLGLDCHLELSAICRVGDSQRLEWELKWPQVTSRKGAVGVSGYTRRVYEYFGSWNILTVSFPQAGDLGKQAARRLRSVPLRLGGREWVKPKVRLSSSGDNGHALIFFALHKLPDQPEHIQQRLDAVNERPLLQWHLDTHRNPQLTVAKAVSRTSLMLSTVVVTLKLRPDQVKEDPLCRENPMISERSDGNCVMSIDMLAKIRQEFLRCTGKPDDGKVPPPVQLRIGAEACKGTSSGDPALPPNTIYIAPHQRKYIMPRASSKEQWRVEVCMFAQDSGPARLNMQVIVALEARMKRPQLLVELLGDQLERYTAALTNPQAADEFCDGIGMQGQQVREKLGAGFAYNHEVVQAALRHAMRKELEKWFDQGHHPKLHITLPKSRRVLLIPDRYGLLEAGEAVMKMPSVGHPFVKQLILGRSPCMGPGELLCLQAVDSRVVVEQRIGEDDKERRKAAREWYDFQECCIILSVLGDRSVADIMQGGDFDGDTAIAIWDERFVDGFRPFPPPQYHLCQINIETVFTIILK
jgi:superfamily II DNA helicase RecQ